MFLTTGIVSIIALLSLNEKASALPPGFYAKGYVNFDESLKGNTEIIGAHLHTGSAATSGPINIIFCGGAPLPGILGENGPCTVTDPIENGDRFSAIWQAEATDLDMAFENGGNAATAVANATSLADGAATTLDTFLDALMSCTETDCDVYFNIHTNYSFATNTGALGLARGQLHKSACTPEFSENVNTVCFGATVNSENTNKVVPNPLAKDAGSVLPIITLDIIVVYTPEPSSKKKSKKSKK